MQTQFTEANDGAATGRGGWSYKSLAARWDCHVRTIRRLVADKRLEVFYVGGAPRVTDESRRRLESSRNRQAAAA